MSYFSKNRYESWPFRYFFGKIFRHKRYLITSGKIFLPWSIFRQNFHTETDITKPIKVLSLLTKFTFRNSFNKQLLIYFHSRYFCKTYDL